MKTPIKKPNVPRNYPKGFALIITLTLMVLMTILAIGLFSLSTVTVRTASQGKAQETAKANARMALMVALGQLQKFTGPDQRITAPANLQDTTTTLPLTGVWNSWKPTSTTTNYQTAVSSRFLGYLMSGPDASDGKLITEIPPIDAKSARLFFSDNPDPTPDVDVSVPVIPIKNSSGQETGGMAWATFDESTKARVNLEPAKAPTTLAEMASHVASPAKNGFISPDFTDFVFLRQTDATLRTVLPKYLSLGTTSLLSSKAGMEKTFFNDLTEISESIQTDVTQGGFKTDLSVLFGNGITSSSSTVSLPADYTGRFVYSNTKTRLNNKSLSEPLWEMYANYANLYINSGLNSSQKTIEAPKISKNIDIFKTKNTELTDALASRNGSYKPIAYNYETNLSAIKRPMLLPTIIRMDMVISLIAPQNTAFKNSGRDMGANASVAYRPFNHLCFQYVPIFTLHNPYNVPISFTGLSIEIGPIPLSFTYKIGPYQASEIAIPFNKIGGKVDITTEPKLLRVNLGNPTVIMKPGETKIFGKLNSDYKTILSLSDDRSVNQPKIADLAVGADLLEGLMNPPTAGNPVIPGGVIIYRYMLPFGAGTNRPNTPPTTPYNTTNQTGKAKWPFNLDGSSQYSQILMGPRLNWGAQHLGDEYAGIPVMPTERVEIKAYLGLPWNKTSGGGQKDVLAGEVIEPTSGEDGKYFNRFYLKMSYKDEDGNNKNYGTHQIYYKGNATGDTSDLRNQINTPPDVAGTTVFNDEVSKIAKNDGELMIGKPMCAFSVDFRTATDTKKIRPAIDTSLTAQSSMSDIVSSAMGKEQFKLSFIDLNANPKGLDYDGTGAFAFTASNKANGGVKGATLYEVPIAPMQTVAQFRHLNIASQGGPTATTYSVAESFAHPTIPLDKTTNVIGNSVYWDHNWLANNTLWDSYWFSTLSPQFGGGYGTSSTASSEVALNFFQNVKALPNSRNTPRLPDGITADVAADTSHALTSDGKSSAEYMMTKGGFNVNSTSVNAWKAVLSSLANTDIYLTPGSGDKKSTGMTGTTFPRTSYRVKADAATTGAAVNWQEFRTLTPAQIDDLANKIVTEIKARGPFLSMAHFVNRQLAGTTNDLKTMGVLQKAINSSTVNSGMSLGSVSSTDVSTYGWKEPAAAEGSTTAGTPAEISQGDILSAIGSFITVRSDTFKIRAYGDARDSSGKILSRATCEAVVQRTPDYVDKVDKANVTTANLTSQANINFGRKYQIVSFRWLNPSEI